MTTAQLISLDQFARDVLRTAKRLSGADRFGDSKVWIAAIIREMGVSDRAEFGRRLFDANHSGLLVLSRCDMAMPEHFDRIRESEIVHRIGGCELHSHFIRTDR